MESQIYTVSNKSGSILKIVDNYLQASKTAIQLTMLFSEPFKIAAKKDVWSIGYDK